MCEFDRHYYEAEIERLRDELEHTRAMLVRLAFHSVPGITEWQIRRIAEFCREQGDISTAVSYIETADYVRKHADNTIVVRADWPEELARLRDEQTRWLEERAAAEDADIEGVTWGRA